MPEKDRDQPTTEEQKLPTRKAEGHGPGPPYNDTHPTHNTEPDRELVGEPEYDDLTGRRPVNEGPHEAAPDRPHAEEDV